MEELRYHYECAHYRMATDVEPCKACFAAGDYRFWTPITPPAVKPRIVVCVEGGVVQQILTDGNAMDVEMYVHDVDRDGRPDISVMRWQPIEQDVDELDAYCRPHGIMAREVNQVVYGDREMVVAVRGGDDIRYYPVVDLGDSPNHPFCIFTIDQSRAIDIREEDLH